MEKYKNLLISKDKKSPAIQHEGKIYYRYMDKIYLPQKAEELSTEDVIALSEARTALDKEVIDCEYSKKVISKLVDMAGSFSTIVDFGCGNGLIFEVFKEKKINPKMFYGLDLSEDSLNKAKNKGRKYHADFVLFDKDSSLSIETESVEAIVSSFVMHFPVSENQIVELYRILKTNGVFVYNDFNFKKSSTTTIKTITKLKKAGFIVEMKEFSFLQDNVEKKHKFIIAKKV
tara:strand:- start:16630 stop:17322 length:693 start_codon:yes stop_codon:yes gene_type:complete